MAENFTQYISTQIAKISPRVAVIGAVLALVVAAGVVYLQSRSEPDAKAMVVPHAARVERVEGSVGIASALDERANSDLEWEEVNRNAPLVAGDRIYARDNSRASVAFSGRNYARLDSGSAFDVLSLTDDRTQLALRNGSALFDLGELADGGLFEVATPNGAVDFMEPGLYQVGIGDDGNTWISVLSGLAQVVGLAGSGEIGKGEMMTLAGQAAAQILLSKLAPDYAGGLVDDYYDYRYADSYDGRYADYDTYLDDPYYYDPYRRSVSYRQTRYDVPGIYDLDYYGDWRDVDGYGQCWAPRVETGWTPYRDGYWDVNNLYGPTWVSQEPWGWTPYHYGRWAYVNNSNWVWVPDRVRQQPAYAPALVAFVPITQSNQIGWVPLAPGEAYVPRYYDASYQPQYLASPEVVSEVVTVSRTYVNASYPQAMTVVPMSQFTQVIEPQVVTPVNPQYLAQAQATLDPYAIESVRRMAAQGENPRRKFKMERALQQQIFATPVVTSATPIAVPGRTTAGETLQVATVPEKQKRQKIKIEESGQVVSAPQPAIVQGRDPRLAQLAAQAAQGDRAARREMKQLRRQQQAPPEAAPRPVPTQNPAAQKSVYSQQPVPQNERQAQKQLRRQQEAPQRQMTPPPTQELSRQQRKAENRAAQERLVLQQQQANQQRKQQRAQELQQQQMIQQRQQQKQMRRQQAPPQPDLGLRNQQRKQQQEQILMQQRQEQMRQVQNQQQQMQQMQKQQRRQQQQQQVQQMPQAKPQVMVPHVDKQQRKAERRAAAGQPAPPVVRPPQQPVYQQPQTVAPPYKAPQQNGTPVSPAKAQRQAEKAQRRGGKP